MLNKTSKEGNNNSWAKTFLDYGKSFVDYSLKGATIFLALFNSVSKSDQDSCFYTSGVGDGSYKNIGDCSFQQSYSNYNGSRFIESTCIIESIPELTPDDCTDAKLALLVDCTEDRCTGNGNTSNHICKDTMNMLHNSNIYNAPRTNETLTIKISIPEEVQKSSCCRLYAPERYGHCCDTKQDNICTNKIDYMIIQKYPCHRKDKTQYYPAFKFTCYTNDDKGNHKDIGTKYPQKQQAPKHNSMFHEKHELKGGHPPISNSDDSSNIPRNKRHK